MRSSSFNINGEWVRGHWSMEKYNVGDFYKSTLTKRLFVVTVKFDGVFETQDGDGNFYQMREATPEEVTEYNKPVNRDAEKKLLEDFFDALDN